MKDYEMFGFGCILCFLSLFIVDSAPYYYNYLGALIAVMGVWMMVAGLWKEDIDKRKEAQR